MDFTQQTNVPASDAARHFSEMVDHVFAGHKYTIMRRNRPVAVIAPLPIVWQMVLYNAKTPGTVTMLGHRDAPRLDRGGSDMSSLWHLVSICPDSLMFDRTSDALAYLPREMADTPWCDMVGETIARNFQSFLCDRTTPGTWHLHARSVQ